MRRTIKVNNEILHKMKEIYYDKKTNNLDWMGNLITEKNHPSYHHITKAEILRKNDESDIATLENGAYLGKISHEQLHRIELIDIDLYNMWNDLFKEINESKTVISNELWERILELKKITDSIDKKDKIRELIR